LIRVQTKTLDLYEKAFPDKPASETFWVALARLEKRLMESLDKKRLTIMDLKMAEMDYTRGIKRIGGGKQT
jgi:hypothetical protein